MTGRLIHKSDHPRSFSIVKAVTRDRRVDGIKAHGDHAFTVNLDTVHDSYLSTTEEAAIDLACALATFEWGGMPGGVAGRAVREALVAIGQTP